MFGFLKKKKKEKVEAPAVEEEKEEKVEDESILKDLAAQKGEILEPDENALSPKEQAKRKKINSLRAKISQMLQSNNVEIIDENEGDEYEVAGSGGSSGDTAKQQQDYDSLKAQYGGSGKKKKEELTLTIDDFDYTYVGKYVEEYDIIHLKSIKKIKLPNPHAKLIKRLSFACLGVVVIVIASFIAYSILRVKPEYLESVSLTQSNQVYYRGEYFDCTGIYFKAEYSTGRVEYTPVTIEDWTGSIGIVTNTSKGLLFDGGTAATLKFHFHGFVGENPTVNTDLELSITVRDRSESGIGAVYTDGIFNLKSGDTITSKHLIPLVEYDKYAEQGSAMLSLDMVKLNIDGTDYSYNSSEKGFVLTADITESSKIKVIYLTNSAYEVELINGANSVTSR